MTPFQTARGSTKQKKNKATLAVSHDSDRREGVAGVSSDILKTKGYGAVCECVGVFVFQRKSGCSRRKDVVEKS